MEKIDLTKEIILNSDEIVKNFSDSLSISQQLILKFEIDKLIQYSILKYELDTVKLFNKHSDFDDYEEELENQLPKNLPTVVEKTGKRIPIKAVQNLAKDYGYDQVIVHAFDRESNIQSVATYGKSFKDCLNAAEGGNTIKRLLGWDEELCNQLPKRKEKTKK